MKKLLIDAIINAIVVTLVAAIVFSITAFWGRDIPFWLGYPEIFGAIFLGQLLTHYINRK